LDRSNIRLGEEVNLTLDRPGDEVRLVPPDGPPRRLNVQDGMVVARGEQLGVHEIRHGEDRTSFSVNALRREESDLKGSITREWGNWLDETALRMEYQDVGWMLLLAALAVAAAHLLLVALLKAQSGSKE
jgi:hypothetical protein